MSPVNAHDLEVTPIPQGLVAWWLGTYASVPSGWEIADGNAAANDATYTRPNLLAKFLKGVATVGTEPGTTGGAATHAHGVTASSHTHTVDSGGNDTTWGGGTGDSWDSTNSHAHTANSSDVGALDADSSEPAYIEGVPIVFTLKSGGTGNGLPRNHDLAASALPPWKAILAWNGAAGSVPAGWSKCNGATVNSVVTPNLLGKYLRGIPTVATEPGTTGGATSHTHTLNHSHVTGGPSATTVAAGSGTAISSGSHIHTTQVTNETSDSGDGEPAYTETHYVIFTGHGTNAAAHASGILTDGDLNANLVAPRGLVVGWGHAIADIPSGWGHCNGAAFANGNPTGYTGKPDCRSKFIKHVANATTNGGTTGGADTHGHTGGTHTHTTGAPGSGNRDVEGGYDVTVASTGAPDQHTHTLGTITWSGNAVGKSTGSGSSLPPYSEVAWLIRD